MTPTHALVITSLPDQQSSADVHTGGECICGDWARGGASRARVLDDFLDHLRENGAL